MEYIFVNIKPIFSTVGLSLDILGVLLVFIYGIPTKIDGAKIEYQHADGKRQKIGPDYGIKAYFGPLLLIIGFALQILSNWV